MDLKYIGVSMILNLKIKLDNQKLNFTQKVLLRMVNQSFGLKLNVLIIVSNV